MTESDLEISHWYKDKIFSSMLPVKVIEITDTEVVLNETKCGSNDHIRRDKARFLMEKEPTVIHH